jgi:NAD(P)-dependent dehydrogenase (short-subunit alcohol dehydrogenase family)
LKGLNTMSFEINFGGKVAVVTGAARGIGRAVAVALADAGSKVVITDISVEGLNASKNKIEKIGGECRTHQADITIKEQAIGLIEEALRGFGRIDILVNCAGILRVASFLETSEEDWDATLDVNLKGTFLCCQAAGRHMAQRKAGKIINVASNAGKVPRMNNSSYCASKAGVILLTRVMALELAKYGITVNALCPGGTDTEMIRIQAGDPKVLDRIIQGDLDTYRAGIPTGRLARPEEQAYMVLYMASEYANHITGQTFFVDGGQTMV